MTYRVRRSGPWGQGLRAPRRRECRFRASFCHEHRLRISLPWLPCRTPEVFIALLCCSVARLFFCEASPEGSVLRTRRSVAEASGGLSRTSSFHQHPHQVAFLHDHVLDAVELDFGPRPLAEQHPVADLDVDRDELAALIATTRADTIPARADRCLALLPREGQITAHLEPCRAVLNHCVPAPRKQCRAVGRMKRLLCWTSHERASALRPETVHCRSLISHSRRAVSVSCASGLGDLCSWSKKYTPLTFATSGEVASHTRVSAPFSGLRDTGLRIVIPKSISRPLLRLNPVATSPGWKQFAVTPVPSRRRVSSVVNRMLASLVSQ